MSNESDPHHLRPQTRKMTTDALQTATVMPEMSLLTPQMFPAPHISSVNPQISQLTVHTSQIPPTGQVHPSSASLAQHLPPMTRDLSQATPSVPSMAQPLNSLMAQALNSATTQNITSSTTSQKMPLLTRELTELSHVIPTLPPISQGVSSLTQKISFLTPKVSPVTSKMSSLTPKISSLTQAPHSNIQPAPSTSRITPAALQRAPVSQPLTIPSHHISQPTDAHMRITPRHSEIPANQTIVSAYAKPPTNQLTGTVKLPSNQPITRAPGYVQVPINQATMTAQMPSNQPITTAPGYVQVPTNQATMTAQMPSNQPITTAPGYVQVLINQATMTAQMPTNQSMTTGCTQLPTNQSEETVEYPPNQPMAIAETSTNQPKATTSIAHRLTEVDTTDDEVIELCLSEFDVCEQLVKMAQEGYTQEQGQTEQVANMPPITSATRVQLLSQSTSSHDAVQYTNPHHIYVMETIDPTDIVRLPTTTVIYDESTGTYVFQSGQAQNEISSDNPIVASSGSINNAPFVEIPTDEIRNAVIASNVVNQSHVTQSVRPMDICNNQSNAVNMRQVGTNQSNSVNRMQVGINQSNEVNRLQVGINQSDTVTKQIKINMNQSDTVTKQMKVNMNQSDTTMKLMNIINVTPSSQSHSTKTPANVIDISNTMINKAHVIQSNTSLEPINNTTSQSNIVNTTTYNIDQTMSTNELLHSYAAKETEKEPDIVVLTEQISRGDISEQNTINSQTLISGQSSNIRPIDLANKSWGADVPGFRVITATCDAAKIFESDDVGITEPLTEKLSSGGLHPSITQLSDKAAKKGTVVRKIPYGMLSGNTLTLLPEQPSNNVPLVIKGQRSQGLAHDSNIPAISKYRLRRRIITQPGEKPFVCDICEKGFNHAYNLKLHLRAHIDDRPYKCDVCHKRFLQPTKLKVHMTSHTKEKKFKCEICGKMFSYIESLKKHSRIHNSDEFFVCEVCGKGFTWENVRNTHMRSHSDHKRYVCDICGKQFTYHTSLKSHTRRHTLPDVFKCEICEQTFAVENAYNRHVDSHLKDVLYTCNVCNKKFSSTAILRRHSRVHDPTTNPYPCTMCVASFDTPELLHEHLTNHAEDRKHICNICGKGFVHLRGLKQHSKIHDGSIKYMCSVCEKGFQHLGNLRMHMRTHTGERPYTCQICSRSFSGSSSLKRHMRVHNRGYQSGYTAEDSIVSCQSVHQTTGEGTTIIFENISSKTDEGELNNDPALEVQEYTTVETDGCECIEASMDGETVLVYQIQQVT